MHIYAYKKLGGTLQTLRENNKQRDKTLHLSICWKNEKTQIFSVYTENLWKTKNQNFLNVGKDANNPLPSTSGREESKDKLLVLSLCCPSYLSHSMCHWIFSVTEDTGQRVSQRHLCLINQSTVWCLYQIWQWDKPKGMFQRHFKNPLTFTAYTSTPDVTSTPPQLQKPFMCSIIILCEILCATSLFSLMKSFPPLPSHFQKLRMH